MWANLEELKSAALLQLLEHGAKVTPAAARSFHVSLVVFSPEQHARRIRKVLLEREQLLQQAISAEHQAIFLPFSGWL